MSAQDKWRVGQHYGIHVYEGETAIATFVGSESFAQENAMKAVAAINAQCEAEPVVSAVAKVEALRRKYYEAEHDAVGLNQFNAALHWQTMGVAADEIIRVLKGEA